MIARACTFILFGLLAPTASAACFDISRGEPAHLEGRLTFEIFPGPPNYENVQTGDTPEPAWILVLDAVICVTGDEFSDPNATFDTVQFLQTETNPVDLRQFLGTRVGVDLGEAYSNHTGHHHAPLLAVVHKIREAAADVATQHGTAATTVRAFYLALEQGSGTDAVRFVIPEKQGKGAYVADNITGFYGSLIEPLRLLDVQPIGDGEFLVLYDFVSDAGRCDGRAIVKTTMIGARSFVRSINALEGC